ncbi:MAG TPA: hypothetical protein VG755_17580 [Nannocystaceae bacterium]|nr:hypothetical protein [Nannocystaceae bacterium]
MLHALACAFAPAQSDAAAQPTILLLAVDGPDAAEQAEAITGHVHGLAEVVASAQRPKHDGDRAWYELARREAEAHDAVAVFWVAREDDSHWVLSVVRPERREIRWRRVEIDPASPSAAIEALGVITRATTSALLADTALQMETTPIPAPAPSASAAPAQAPAPVAAPAPTRGRFVIAAGYAGTSFAREAKWQSGIAFEAGWAWRFGLHALVGYTAYQRVRAQSPLGRVELARTPITAWIGWHGRTRALGYGADAGVIVDYTKRHAIARGSDVAAERDHGGVTTALAARVRGSVVVVWRLEVFAAVGLEAWLSRVRYAVRDSGGELHDVLNPRRVRATVSAGLAVRI